MALHLEERILWGAGLRDATVYCPSLYRAVVAKQDLGPNGEHLPPQVYCGDWLLSLEQARELVAALAQVIAHAAAWD